ncbi:PBP1A family penicillin-binding protein [Bacillus shivajii]|uniref:transglycosylase domain-containing protein n=1 Tax=Bacillus shivajii TaxID=1983719 RepID=UPI001CFAD56E|nr:PBP1A family penicillin-binding protein [Bacillus shivajii]UCZ54333.1 PBP1A family penicillin-binding protein [Bacillus shivajii]
MSKKRVVFSFLFVVSVFVIGFTLYLGIILFGNYVIDDKQLVMNAATTIEDPNGEEITKLFVENRQMVSLEEVPEHVLHAFLSVEDHRFYDHQGVDFRAIGRALYRDIIARSKVEGGSTITQQLAKNTFLSHEKTWLRKTKEVLIAINLEREYSKDDILEMYLNRIYFGHGAHGIQAASQLYFDKHVSELTIDEGALLAALPKGPNSYSPIQHPERSEQRRNLVLSLMERRGYLTADEAVRLQGRTVPSDPTKMTENPAYLSYMDLVLDEAEKKYNLSRDEVLKGGYRIVVEMDSNLQEVTFAEFQHDANFPQSTGENKVEGSIVLIDNGTGGVLAAQGGREYVRQGFNRVHAKRQPGSAIKPQAVYAPALETGSVQPYSLLKDELMDYDGYSPRNYNHQYSGEMTMYDAIKHSANAPAVWLLNQIGLDHAKEALSLQSIEAENEGLGLALGGMETGVTPLQLASSYRTYATGGQFSEAYFIREIYDRNGKLIAEREVEAREVISPQTAWHMTRMLEAVVNGGTARHGEFQGPLAGKTGTTSHEFVDGGARDIWFAGFTPEISGAIWMGYDRSDENHYLTEGSAVPTVLFKNILTKAALDDPQSLTAFEKPDGVEDLQEPIRFVAINDLSARLSLSWRGGNVNLTWSGSDDHRLHYHIYEKVANDQYEKVGEVVGKNEYTVQGVNLLSNSEYVVVPYNPQINREGEPSNIAEAKFHLFSYDDAS